MRFFASAASDKLRVRAEVCRKARSVNDTQKKRNAMIADERRKERRSEPACHVSVLTNQ
jgi:hypothetical protein